MPRFRKRPVEEYTLADGEAGATTQSQDTSGWCSLS